MKSAKFKIFSGGGQLNVNKTAVGLNFIQKKFYSAFTLAEVLIALVIIGVIAAITIPSLLQSTNKEEIVAKVRKAHSVLSQSVTKIAVDSGYPVGDFSFMANNDFFNYFTKQINTMKICNGSQGGCFSKNANNIRGGFWNDYSGSSTSLIAADGIAYQWGSGGLCGNKGLSADDEQNCIGRFIVDINGDAKPNKFGYDIFFFAVVDKKGIVPAGSGNNSADCKRWSDGITCAARVLKEGKVSYI